MTAADRPTVPHPDLDTLADLDAGVLDPAAAEDVAAHVGGCARCAGVLAAFDTVRADLLALPAPELPAPVAARLDAVFADLRRQAAGPTATGPTATGPAATGPTT
jgi:anti-sigma factor ChrR (cupin superfamily)